MTDTRIRTRSGSDLGAGLSTAAVVVPKAMAYAAVAGLPLEIGLYTSLVALVVYAASGTSRPLSVTTTSTVGILTAGVLSAVGPPGDPGRVMAVTSLTLVVGCVLLAAAALRVGFLADFISQVW